MNQSTLGQLRLRDGEHLRVVIDHAEPERTVLAFLNGMGAILDYWDPVVEKLADFTCIRYDRPGLGGSPPSTQPSSDITTEVDRLTAVLAATGSSCSRTVLVGHSYGGLLAETAVRLLPERFSGLVLVDGTDPNDHADDNTLAESALASALSVAVHVPGVSRLIGSAVERVVAHSSTVVPDGPRLGSAQRALVETSRHVRGTFAEDLRIPRQCRQAIDIAATHDYPNIPTAILVAGDGRTLKAKRQAREWVGQNQRRVGQFGDKAELQILQSGHLMMFDEPDAVASAIREIASGESA